MTKSRSTVLAVVLTVVAIVVWIWTQSDDPGFTELGSSATTSTSQTLPDRVSPKQAEARAEHDPGNSLADETPIRGDAPDLDGPDSPGLVKGGLTIDQEISNKLVDNADGFFQLLLANLYSQEPNWDWGDHIDSHVVSLLEDWGDRIEVTLVAVECAGTYCVLEVELPNESGNRIHEFGRLWKERQEGTTLNTLAFRRIDSGEYQAVIFHRDFSFATLQGRE